MTKNSSPTTHEAIRTIDIAPFLRLLSMAGPLSTLEIVAAFLDDLKSTKIGLESAWDGPDCAALRLHSHVLIALAGTVGDIDLQALAQGLNGLAQTRDLVKIHAMKVHVMRSLADLITTLTTIIPTKE